MLENINNLRHVSLKVSLCFCSFNFFISLSDDTWFLDSFGEYKKKKVQERKKQHEKKNKKQKHTQRYERVLQHKRVEPEKTKKWNVWNMKEFNVRKVQQLKVQYEKVQSEKGKTWMEPNM